MNHMQRPILSDEKEWSGRGVGKGSSQLFGIVRSPAVIARKQVAGPKSVNLCAVAEGGMYGMMRDGRSPKRRD